MADSIRDLIRAREAAWEAAKTRDIRDNSSEALALRVAWNEAWSRVEEHPLSIAIIDCAPRLTESNLNALLAACRAAAATDEPEATP